jgi:hypothetical protein
MIFRRFGNAYVAQDNSGTIYCVSLYCGSWSANYLPAGEDEVKKIGLYGHPSPAVAQKVCHSHAAGEKVS